jgi:lipopolysaccharide/colanic/teichoic acid biosynthesis glycosyltransferase
VSIALEAEEAAQTPPAARRAPDHQTIDLAALQLRLAQHSRLALACKRGFDIVAAALGLLLAAPLLLLITLLIRLESRGPLVFRQPRMGRGQRPFNMLKLRTMDQAGANTRVGRLLRPLGLDELPQLWHVLVGQMSVVGPRPEVLDRVAGHMERLPHYWARHLMRPGITGWAQVNGLRGEASSIPSRVACDLEYIGNWSLRLDARILLQTVGTVWRDTRRTLGR